MRLTEPSPPCVAIDIGGTGVKWALGRAGAEGAIELEHVSVVDIEENTARSLSAAVKRVLGEARAKCNTVAAVGIATTGSVRSDEVVAAGSFFDGYVDFSWQEALASDLGDAKVRVINDGQAAALGSYFGDFAGRRDPLALFTVGTGIGGGLVCNGKLMRGGHGFAGAFGHVKVRLGDDTLCICGRPGCAENVGSGRGLAAAWLERPASPHEVGPILDEVVRLARGGDDRALRSLHEVGTALGLAIADIANALDPDVVVITGGVIHAAQFGDANPLVESAIATAKNTCTPRIGRALEVTVSALPNPNLVGITAYVLAQADSTA